MLSDHGMLVINRNAQVRCRLKAARNTQYDPRQTQAQGGNYFHSLIRCHPDNFYEMLAKSLHLSNVEARVYNCLTPCQGLLSIAIQYGIANGGHRARDAMVIL